MEACACDRTPHITKTDICVASYSILCYIRFVDFGMHSGSGILDLS